MANRRPLTVVSGTTSELPSGDTVARDWLEPPRLASPSFVSPLTPDGTKDVVNVPTLTGAITINAPSGTPVDGQQIRFRFEQDSTGGRVITWDSSYAFGSDVTQTLIPLQPNARWEQMFSWDETTAKWRALAIVRGF